MLINKPAFYFAVEVARQAYLGLSNTARSLPPALFASQRIWPEALIPRASVSVKPVPGGISVLRSTNPFAVAMKGTCFPGLGGWYWVWRKTAVPTTWPEMLIALAVLARAPLIAPKSVQTPLL